MEERMSISKLFDKYKNLLTENQQNILNDYFILDITISEIAENKQATRQAIKSIIDKAVKKLLELEIKLNGTI